MTAVSASPQFQVPTRPVEFDTALIERCRLGNPVAIQSFVRHHQQMVFAFLARLLGPRSVVEDLAQEVFVRALRALPQFDPGGPARLSTWLFTIASRLALDEMRRAPRRAVSAQAQPQAIASIDGPEALHHRRELAAAMSIAVYSLSHDQREAFILVEIHGLSMEELADVTGVAVGTAKARLSRAREHLREQLGSLWEEVR
jgi:RNA polymerase sigma-70 factor (ECF subfamily)